MNIIKKDGKVYAQFEKEVYPLLTYNRAIKNDLVEYDGVIYLFQSWGYNSVYLEDLNGKEIEFPWF